jgi:hypothetical protein
MADVHLNTGLVKNLFPTLYAKRCPCIYRKDQPINDVQYNDL